MSMKDSSEIIFPVVWNQNWANSVMSHIENQKNNSGVIAVFNLSKKN